MDNYTFLAGSYDLLTTDVGYPQWADYVQWHFKRQKTPVRTVAELACGTGSLTKLLAERGYDMTAIDLSPDMLALASEKCGDLPVLFLCQDMSRLTLLEPVDAVICCLDSVNYVTKPAAMKRTFQRVYKYLKPGGLFLCSGIIDTRAGEVADALRQNGWEIETTPSGEGWYSYACR